MIAKLAHAVLNADHLRYGAQFARLDEGLDSRTVAGVITNAVLRLLKPALAITAASTMEEVEHASQQIVSETPRGNASLSSMRLLVCGSVHQSINP